MLHSGSSRGDEHSCIYVDMYSTARLNLLDQEFPIMHYY